MPHRSTQAGGRVLVCAPFGQDGPGLLEMLEREGIAAELRPDLPALAAALDQDVGAVLLTEEALAGGLEALQQHLARQPPWSDLPFVLLTAPASSPGGRRYDARARMPESARNVILLERPLRRGSIISAVDAALRGRAWQLELRNRLQELEDGREALRASEVQLRHAADELEARVEARTAALNAEIANRARTEEALRQSQKMEAVGQLTGGVAHDFNNLLTVIRSSVDFLKRDGLTEARRSRYVQAISDTTERATKLTGQLLAFARRQPLKPELFDVRARIESVADLVRPLVGARVSIALDLFPDEAEPRCANADVSQFETALVNLAVNARDAMDGDGVLTFRARSVAVVPPIRGHVGAKGDFIAITVADTGEGVAADKADLIFEPFYTTKEVGRGTGLGLSQVFGFVKQSGGEIEVESVSGEGARFTIYLPASTPHRSPEAASHAPSGEPDVSALCVLLVEDNEGVGQFATEMLQDLGHATIWAGSADRALVELEHDPARFDVVFSDVIMPGMNGIELALRIRALAPKLPVVLTSGYSEVLAAEGTHGFALLSKPYTVTGLEAALRDAVVGARAARDLATP